MHRVIAIHSPVTFMYKQRHRVTDSPGPWVTGAMVSNCLGLSLPFVKQGNHFLNW